jgi:hypothetical protein
LAIAEADLETGFTAAAIIGGILALASPALLWALGMHMGFGGSTLYAKFHWFGGNLYEYDYQVPPSYGNSACWPCIIGFGIIFPCYLALVGITYKTTMALKKVAQKGGS